jgi:hypothetical protein
MKSEHNVGSLVDEYCNLFAGVRSDSTGVIENLLVREGDWSQQAALHLLELARNYGSFMLRNALAILLALGIEDGDLGF